MIRNPDQHGSIVDESGDVTPRITGGADLGGVRDALSFWRSHRDVRPFFVAQAQGAIGDGAGYVALLLLAYDRFGSAWAATALTLADFGPAMLLGPLLGALVDRHGRLRSAIVSDAIRAVAFAGLLFVHSAAGMVALAVLAGVGTALFRPATGALLPTLTTSEQLGRRQRADEHAARRRAAARAGARRPACC